MPSIRTMPDGTTSTSPATKARSDSGMLASISSRITEPRRRRFSALSYRRTRSSASSSTSMSLSRMTRNAPFAEHLEARKQEADEGDDQAVERDEARGRAERAVRQAHEALDAARNAHQRAHRPPVLRIEQFERQREAEIGNERERMRRIDGERRQDREDVLQEIILQPVALPAGEIGDVEDDDAARRELACAARASAPAGKRPAPRPVRRSARAARPACGRPSEISVDARQHLPDQAGDADHEEFVEIVGRDRQEPQPLEQRMVRVRRFFQHAPVELEPGQLAIDEALRASVMSGDGRRLRDGLRGVRFDNVVSSQRSAPRPSPAFKRSVIVTEFAGPAKAAHATASQVARTARATVSSACG